MKTSIVVVNDHPRVTTGAFEGPVGSTAVWLADDVVVWIDPADPVRFLGVDVLGPWEESRELLAELLGSAVLAAPGPVSVGAVGPSQLEVDLESANWRLLRTLGFLLWLEEYSTLDLDERDLDIEIGLVASRLAHLGTAQLADARLTRSAAHLLSGVGPFLLQGGPVPRTATDWLLVDAAVVASDSGVLGLTPEQRKVIDGLAVGERPPLADLPPLVALPPRRENLSLAASASGDLRSSVDWRRVPRGVLDSEELTIRFSHDVEAALLEVRVDAAARESALLIFEVLDPLTHGVVVAGPLALEQDGSTYRGTARLVSDRVGTLVVEVRSVLSELEPAYGIQRTQLLAMRQAARALLAERLVAVIIDIAESTRRREEAAARWELAALEFSDAAEDTDGVDDYRAQLCRDRAASLRGGDTPRIEPLTLAEVALLAKT